MSERHAKRNDLRNVISIALRVAGYPNRIGASALGRDIAALVVSFEGEEFVVTIERRKS